MHRLISYLSPLLLLLIFILIMNSSELIKSKKITEEIAVLDNFLKRDDWKNAEVYLKKLKDHWGRNVKLLQFSVERSEIRNINTGIARLSGSLKAKDKASAIIELSYIKSVWSQLGS